MWTYNATVTRCLDGDTVEATVDCGFYIYVSQRFRLMGYNAPEVHGPEKAMGLQATAILESMILNKTVILRTFKADSFGRFLCSVEIERGDVVEALISGGWGVPWDGKGSRPGFGDGVYPIRA